MQMVISFRSSRMNEIFFELIASLSFERKFDLLPLWLFAMIEKRILIALI